MHTSTTIQPGQRGAKKFMAQYGDRLVCVRYRQDEQRKKRFKTVELIVEEWSWTPPPPRRRKESRVFVKVAFPERELRRQMGDNQSIFNNHHVYVTGVGWLGEDKVEIKIWGYGDIDPRGFTLRYEFTIGDGFKKLQEVYESYDDD